MQFTLHKVHTPWSPLIGTEDCKQYEPMAITQGILFCAEGKSQTTLVTMFATSAVPTSLTQVLPPKIMIDCSHGNSEKIYQRQMQVVESVCQQIEQGSDNIIGVMLESFLDSRKATAR